MKELETLSIKLTEQSDEVNQFFNNLDEELATAEIDLEVWVDNNPITVGPKYQERDGDGDVREGSETYTREERQLGYYRFINGWKLAHRGVVVQLTPAMNGRGEDEEIIDVTGIYPLSEADRETRLRAMRLVPQLLTLLKSEAEWLLDSIAKARESVEAL